MMDYVLARGPYILPMALIVIGVYGLIANRNYVKTVIGLFLVQSGLILFFIVLAAKLGATVPILLDSDEPVGLHNPLPHAMMLTAIVVGVVNLGVAMAILRRIQDEEGSVQQIDAAASEGIDP
jgi:multicomponent Na+:H+ antiporter subunit C